MALCRVAGSTCEYVPGMKDIEGRPSISDTILGLTLWDRSSMAQVCRRSWKRISGSAEHLKSRAKERFLRLWKG